MLNFFQLDLGQELGITPLVTAHIRTAVQSRVCLSELSLSWFNNQKGQLRRGDALHCTALEEHECLAHIQVCLAAQWIIVLAKTLIFLLQKQPAPVFICYEPSNKCLPQHPNSGNVCMNPTGIKIQWVWESFT